MWLILIKTFDKSIMWFWRIRCMFCPQLALARCAWEKKQLPQSKSIFTSINQTSHLSIFSQFLTNHMFTKLACYIHVIFDEYVVQYNANIMPCSCQKRSSCHNPNLSSLLSIQHHHACAHLKNPTSCVCAFEECWITKNPSYHPHISPHL